MSRRERGDGSVFQRQTGKRAGQWVAQLDLGWSAKGRHYKQFTGATQREVLEKLQKARNEQSRGALAYGPRQTVAQYLEYWLEHTVEPNLRPSTHASYEISIRLHILPVLGRLQLTKLSPQHLEAFLNDRRKTAGLAPRTVQYLHAILRSALSDAMYREIVSRNVAKLVKAPRVTREEITPLSPEDAVRFLAAVKGDRLEALYSVALAVGLRRGEALGLQWEDIDLDAAMMHIRKALQSVGGVLTLVDVKSRTSNRSIPLPAFAVRALRQHKRRQIEERLAAGPAWKDTGYVFTTAHGTPLDGRNVLRYFQGILERAEIPKKRFHDLRHTCASLLLAQGEHPRAVMELLGHSQISLTMNTYSHVFPSVLRGAADKMDELLGNGS
ncbi:MAG: tyrosine-type recombinase/integrase [Chloroflexota bacterium]